MFCIISTRTVERLFSQLKKVNVVFAVGFLYKISPMSMRLLNDQNKCKYVGQVRFLFINDRSHSIARLIGLGVDKSKGMSLLLQPHLSNKAELVRCHLRGVTLRLSLPVVLLLSYTHLE